MQTTKVCTKCRIEKSVERFSKSSHSKSGYYPICKDCMKQYKKEHAEQIKSKNKEYNEKNKEKIRQYYKDNHDIRLEKRLIYKARNKEKLFKSHRRYYEENREKILERSRNYYQDNKDKARETRRRYRENNPDKIREIRKKYNATEKARQIYVANQNNRRSLKARLPSTFTALEWNQCKTYFGNKCAYCGRELHNLHQDHFVALANGGEYTKNNIVPACKSCNSSKSNRDFFEWYPQQPFYSRRREHKILTYLNYKGTAQQLALF